MTRREMIMKEYNEPTLKIMNFEHENVVTDSLVQQALPEELTGYTSGSDISLNTAAYIIDWN
jgi:hypothetical protein